MAKRYDVSRLTWLDHARWVASENAVYWRMEFPLLKQYVEASGCNVMEPDGEQTVITVNGELLLDFSSVRFMPKLVANRLIGQTEKFVLKMIEPNLKKINRGLERFLDDQSAQQSKQAKKTKK